MNRKLKSSEWAGVLFTCVIGTLFHFIYEFSGNSPLVALIAPVSESTWEHLKMLVFPMIFYTLIQYFSVGKKYANFMFGRFIGMLTGMLTITAAFYTYSGVIGTNYLFCDILTFLLGVFTAYFTAFKITKIQKPLRPGKTCSVFLIALLAITFMIFTFYPPSIPLFIAP